MTTTSIDPQPAAPPREPRWSRFLRVLGWVLIVSGVVVGLFVVYLLWWTDRATAAAQVELVRSFEDQVLRDVAPGPSPGIRDLANIPVRTEGLPDDAEPNDTVAIPDDGGDSYALLWFQRGDEFIVSDGVLGAVEGVNLHDLRAGPGHYPDAEAPGQAGNVAFAGHRTTHGRPFHDLDLLQTGDEIHVLDRSGRHWVYDWLENRIVAPTDTWVVDDEAVEGVGHLLTLTSCHPKYSAAQRIVAFAELRQDAAR